MAECRKCHKKLYMCQKCNGRGGISDFGNKVNCKTCNGTGLMCPSHDGLWN